MRKLIASLVFAVAVLLQIYLLSTLGGQTGIANYPLAWLFVHSILSLLAAASVTYFASFLTPGDPKGLFVFSAFICLSMPLAGSLGCLGALLYGIHNSNNRHIEDVYWQFTKNAELPFIAPIGREITKRDSRGFVEQLAYSEDSDALYKKVLAAGKIQNSLSVGALKAAVKHKDDRIRLTAYQTMDRKVSDLNKQIQTLEEMARGQGAEDQSNTWLQIASNYWELLTLEKDEPIAREQLLKKASEAAINAIRILPTNRNAHFTLGRIALVQGKERIATVAFERSMALGMPIEKALPYKAEAAFKARDFESVAKSIDQIDESYKQYPPLSHVAGYWS